MSTLSNQRLNDLNGFQKVLFHEQFFKEISICTRLKVSFIFFPISKIKIELSMYPFSTFGLLNCAGGGSLTKDKTRRNICKSYISLYLLPLDRNGFYYSEMVYCVLRYVYIHNKPKFNTIIYVP